MLSHQPTSLAECDERLDRLRRALHECGPDETVLIRGYTDTIGELEAARLALLPDQREP